jgi:hypothetical protein
MHRWTASGRSESPHPWISSRSVGAWLAAMTVSVGLAGFAPGQARAQTPWSSQPGNGVLQAAIASPADDRTVAPQPLIVQCDAVAPSGPAQFPVAPGTQPYDGRPGMTLTSGTEASFNAAPIGMPAPVCDGNACATAHWFDTLELFGGLEGSKQPQDFGTNAEFGGRLHVNWGVPLLPDLGIGLQVGTAVDLTDNAVQVFERIEGNTDRVQNFTTIGLFQRTDWGLNWGVAYDFLFEDYYDNFNLGQVRAKVGYQLTPCDEIGAWGTIATEKDNGTFGAIPVTLRPIDQASLFWRHTWENCAQTTFWIGGCPGHGQVNVALGDLPPTGPRVVFGSDLHIPLSDSWALFGEANFLTPANSGTVDAYLGFCYYFGGTAHGFRQRLFSPVLPVADATSFAVDLGRR